MITPEVHRDLTRKNFVIALNMAVTEARLQQGMTLADIAARIDWSAGKLDEALTYPSNLNMEQISLICIALQQEVKFTMDDMPEQEASFEASRLQEAG